MPWLERYLDLGKVPEAPRAWDLAQRLGRDSHSGVLAAVLLSGGLGHSNATNSWTMATTTLFVFQSMLSYYWLFFRLALGFFHSVLRLVQLDARSSFGRISDPPLCLSGLRPSLPHLVSNRVELSQPGSARKLSI